MAAWLSSAADRWPLSFDAIRCRLLPVTANLDQTCKQLVLCRVEFRFVVVARLAGRFEVEQLRAQPGVVVGVELRLLLDPFGEPDGAADGRQRECEQAADQAHWVSPEFSCASAKLYGGSGPT